MTPPAFVPHTCTPGVYCGLCVRNRSTTGGASMISTRRCALLGEGVQLAGSTKRWFRCHGGYGTQLADARGGLVCACTTYTPQVWRLNDECGPICPGYTNTLLPPKNPVAGLLRALNDRLPLPVVAAPPIGSPPPKWAYGVTTVLERRNTLLPHTLRQLAAAGFPTPRLWADDCVDPAAWSTQFGLEVVGRHPRAGAFVNWYLALAELVAREPAADRYAIFQDDLLVSAGLREYLDGFTFPANGYWNLYTVRKNQALVSKDHRGWFKSNQLGKGALGLVFDRAGAVALLASKDFLDRPQNAHRGHRNIDGGVVDCLKKVGFVEWVHTPSLLQHTGEVSAIGHRVDQPAPTFAGDTLKDFSGGKV